MTSRKPNPNKGTKFKMTDIDVGYDHYDLLTSDDPVTYSVTPLRVSQRSKPQEGSVTSQCMVVFFLFLQGASSQVCGRLYHAQSENQIHSDHVWF